MNGDNGLDVSELRITGGATDDGTVPAEVLVRILTGMSRSVAHLVAAESSATLEGRRLRAASLVRENTVRVGVPKKGSYCLPLSITSELEQRRLFSEPPRYLERLSAFYAALGTESWGQAEAMMPGGTLFGDLVKELQKMLPKEGENWGFELRIGKNTAKLTSSTYEAIRQRSAKKSTLSQRMVFGELVWIDFEKKKIRFRPYLSSQELTTDYRPEQERSLLAERALQVYGHYRCDQMDSPVQIVKTEYVLPIDLSPASFSALRRSEDGGKVSEFVLSPPVVLHPRLDEETKQYFVAEVPDLGLHLAGQSREELMDDFRMQVFFLWDEYVCADEGELTEDAEEFRNRLRQRITVQEAQ